MARGSRGVGLKWKIIGTFVGLITLLGILVVGLVYYLTGRTLRTQLDQRASAIATNLSDVAAAHVVVKNVMALHALVTKYAILKGQGVAYVFIEDGQGEVIAHSVGGAFPRELWERLSFDARRKEDRRELMFRGGKVYETRAPILEGQVGTVHVGIRGDVVEEEIQRALLPLVGIIALVLAVGSGVSVLLARGIIRPILRLTQIADKISMGDLDTPVGVESTDEIGDLAQSVERMRASLKAAMARLSRG